MQGLLTLVNINTLNLSIIPMTKHVLIVGFGYLGGVLASLLSKHHHTISAIKRNPSNTDLDIHFIYKDIFDVTIDDIPTVDFIVYAAAPDKHTEQDYKKTYVDGVGHMLKLYEEKEHHPARFIFISSTSVYGYNDGRWVTEDTPPHPTTPTAKLLLQAEQKVNDSPIDSTIIRFSGIYGPNRMPLLNAVKTHQAHICYDTRYSNRIHVVDCARMIYHVMHLEKNAGLYIGTDCEPTPINTIVSWLSTHLGIQLPESRHNESPETIEQKANKKLSNEKILHTGFRFEFNNFHQGFNYILFKEEHPKKD